VILLNDVVQVLDLSGFDPAKIPFVVHPDRYFVGSTLVNVDSLWSTVVARSLVQKFLRRTFVRPLGQKKINSVAFLVYCSI
jgi:hypothetical protein